MTPLTEEALGKLVPGRSVVQYRKHPYLSVVNEVAADGILTLSYNLGSDAYFYATPSYLTHIGTLTEDGWIEGEWSENPVPGMVVEWRSADGFSGRTEAHRLNWAGYATSPVVAFRPGQREATIELSKNLGELKSAQPENRIISGLKEVLSGDVSVRAQPEPATGGEVETEGAFVTIPKEPSNGLLMSMAMRWDHGLGCPGYYDKPIFGGSASHADRLRSAMSTMRQLHEEVVGSGFYAPEREAEYVAALGKTSREVG